MEQGRSGVRSDRTLQVVLVIVAVGFFARLAFLGARVSHFDEARVAWWGWSYFATGEVQYRFIIHGPFMQHAHRLLFAAIGASDVASRAPVAIVGGLLPLVALWVRHRLSNVEVASLALLLAFNPILLYYSRFTRSTVLVAAFCFVAFVAFVRWHDGFGHRYLYAGAAFLALGFAAKENAVIYVLCWLGAAALLVNAELVRPQTYDTGRDLLEATVDRWRGTYERNPEGVRTRLLGGGGHLVGATVVFVVVAVFFFAPRGGEAGLWTSPLAATLEQTWTGVHGGFEYWFGHSGETTMGTYRDRLGLFVKTMLRYAAPLSALALVGFVVERYGRADSRRFVLGSFYWGAASVVGYPLGADIWGAWLTVNAVVPLAIPAAVGLTYVAGLARDAHAEADYAGVATAAVLLILLGGVLAGVGVSGVYLSPTDPDNGLAQFAQPQQEMRPAIDDVVAVAGASADGPDVVFYGGENVATMAETAERTPACLHWFRTLPWAWYLEANGVSVSCAQSPGQLPDPLPPPLPPAVVAEAECTLERTVDCRERPEALVARDDVGARLPADYQRHGFLLRTTGGVHFDGMVVYVARDEAADATTDRVPPRG